MLHNDANEDYFRVVCDIRHQLGLGPPEQLPQLRAAAERIYMAIYKTPAGDPNAAWWKLW